MQIERELLNKYHLKILGIVVLINLLLKIKLMFPLIMRQTEPRTIFFFTFHLWNQGKLLIQISKVFSFVWKLFLPTEDIIFAKITPASFRFQSTSTYAMNVFKSFNVTLEICVYYICLWNLFLLEQLWTKQESEISGA